MMTQFRLAPARFRELRNMLLRRQIPVTILAVGAGLYMSQRNQDPGTTIWAIIAPVVLIAVGAGVYMGISRQRKLYNSYVLTFDNILIEREQYNTQTIRIPYNDVKGIVRNKNGGYAIIGNAPGHTIQVPPQLENMQDFEALVDAEWPVVAQTAAPFLQRYPAAIALGMIALMLLFYVATNPIVIGITGTALLGVLGYSMFQVQRHRSIDRSTKRSMWIMVILLLSVLASMYLRIFGTASLEPLLSR